MEYSVSRVAELVDGIEWKDGNVLRILWVRYNGARGEFASGLRRISGGDATVPLVVRGTGFFSPNAVLADVCEIFEENQAEFDFVRAQGTRRVTVLLLAKDEFRLSQGGSPITLPDWFPVLPGRETFFHIADLGLAAEERMLDCPEARIEQVSELVFDLEVSIVNRLEELLVRDEELAQRFLDIAHSNIVGDRNATIAEYKRQLATVQDRRKYRPNAAADGTSLISRLLKLTLNNSPKQLAVSAKALASCFENSAGAKLNPTLFAAMLRPATKMDVPTANWHAILVAFYQAYQLMNGAAHAGEYPSYAVTLQFANSVNLRTFFLSARDYIDSLISMPA